MFSIIITLFIIVIGITYLLVSKPKIKNHESLNLPPSPPELPVIGHLHHLMGQLPHRALTALSQQFGPVLHLKLGQVSTVVISSREAAKQAIKDQDPACADRPESIGTNIMWYNSSDIAFSPYNEYWRQMRKICILELLSAKNVKSFSAIRQDQVSRLVQSLARVSGQTVNITDRIFACTSAMTSRAAFGEVRKDTGKMVSVLREAVTMAGGFELADLFPGCAVLNWMCWNKYRLRRMRKELDKILDAMVEEHVGKRNGEYGGEDIVDVLLRMKFNGHLKVPIHNVNIKAIIFDMFSAGTETTSTTIEWVMAELMRNPVVMTKAQTEVREAFKGKMTIQEEDIQGLHYLKCVIKEALRLHPPIPLLPRACRDECTVDGYSIPLKSKVMINVWSMGRDPKYWDQPETFSPQRFEKSSVQYMGNDMEFIPFGAGRRMCPGMAFGMANVELPLVQLLYHFDWKLPNGITCQDIDMTEAQGIATSRKKPLYLIPILFNNN